MSENSNDFQTFTPIVRTIDESWIFEKATWFKIAFYILNCAAYKDNEKTRRGELIFSYRSLAKKLRMSPYTIQKFLNTAKVRQWCSLKMIQHRTILHVTQYDKYVLNGSTANNDCTPKEHKTYSKGAQSVLQNGTSYKKKKEKEYTGDSAPVVSENLELPGFSTSVKKKSKRKKVSHKNETDETPKEGNPIWELRQFWEQKWNWLVPAKAGEFIFLKRDWRHLKTLREKYGDEDCRIYMEEFLQEDKPSLIREGYPLGIALCYFEHYRDRDEKARQKKLAGTYEQAEVIRLH
jgi:hypothetical protein